MVKLSADSRITAQAYRSLGCDGRVPVLVDTGAQLMRPDYRLTTIVDNPVYFIIWATSPRLNRYKEWAKRETPMKIVIRNWSWEETYGAGYVFKSSSSRPSCSRIAYLVP